MILKVLMMPLVVRFCSKLKWIEKLNNSGDFAGQATFDIFDFYLIAKSWFWWLNIVVKDILVIPWLEENLWYFCNGKKLKKKGRTLQHLPFKFPFEHKIKSTYKLSGIDLS